jgi:exoribonuclease R
VYLPGTRVPQYPTVLSEHAASLLPDGERPAVLLTVRIAPTGDATLLAAERAIVRSRAQLSYETATADELGLLLAEVARRVTAAEDARGATRIEFPEQDVVADPSAPGGLRLVLRGRNVCEDQNSALSLAANLAVAATMLAEGVGVFRVMAEPDEHELASLRHSAAALGVTWPADIDLHQLERTLERTDPTNTAFLLAARRAGGGASYALLTDRPGSFTTTAPWHAAIAAPYAHATAPLRRLADRYVLDQVCALHERTTVPPLPVGLAEIMDRADSLASKVDRAAIDLVEAVTLVGRVGDVFEAAVIDNGHDGAQVQLLDPPVRARVRLAGVAAGARVRLRLDGVDVPSRRLELSGADDGPPVQARTVQSG